MNGDVIAVLFLAGIVQIAFLYYFFNLCSNVSSMQKALENSEPDYFSLYTKHLAFGNDLEARLALENYIWYKMMLIRNDKTREKLRREYYDSFRKTNEPKLNDLGGVWPNYDIFKK